MMKKITKIILSLFILAFMSFSICNLVYADTNNTIDNNIIQNSGQISTTVKTTTSSENELLSPTNIINILLISVGIVLILLSIAIFTRLKKW